MSQTCEAKEDHQAKAKHKANIKHSDKKKTKHLGQPGEQGEDKHAPEVPPVTGEVSRVAQAVRSHGEDDEAQELRFICVVMYLSSSPRHIHDWIVTFRNVLIHQNTRESVSFSERSSPSATHIGLQPRISLVLPL